MKVKFKGVLHAGVIVISSLIGNVMADTISFDTGFSVFSSLIVDGGDTFDTIQVDNATSLSQFDPSLGTLTGVTFNLTSEVNTSLLVVGYHQTFSGSHYTIAGSLYAPTITDAITAGNLFQGLFSDNSECSGPGSFVCTNTESDHFNEIYNESFIAAALAGYQGLGSYDVTISQILEVSVNPQEPNGGYEAGFVGDWEGNLEVVYTYSVVPVPASVWLFSSGILGVFTVARRRLI